MPAIKSLRQFAEDLLSFQKFVLSYQETTVYQMQQVRDAVLGSRSFMEGLLNSFVDIKQVEDRRQARFLPHSPAKKQVFSTLTKNGQTAAVLISFETRLAGETLSKTFDMFADYLHGNPEAQPILIGQTGSQMYAKSVFSERPSRYFPLSESLQNPEEINALIKHLLMYEHVIVFTPVFKTLINQPPRMVNLTGEEAISTIENVEEKNAGEGILFEPSPEAVRAFFEVQIVAALFRQLTQEARLATLGGRITTLEQTYYTLAQQITKIDQEERIAVRKLKDKRQRARLSGMLLWR